MSFPSIPIRAHRRRAFTLIEILIVLTIIGILAAILFPVFSNAREAARRTTCASNLKQIGQGIAMYVQDNNRFYPVVDSYSLSAQQNCSMWVERIYKYVGAPGVFECPDAENGEYRTGCPATEAMVGSPTGGKRWDGSYDLNTPGIGFTIDWQGNPTFNYTDYRPLHEARYTRPSSTILALDGDGYVVSPGTQQPLFEGTEGLLKYGVNPHHNEGCNVVFVDGHVKWLSMDALAKRSLWTINGPE